MNVLAALLLSIGAGEEASSAELLGWPARLSDESAPGLQEDDRKNEFAINVNLWPILESTRLPTGERRTALWPLFHVSTLPSGDTYSWHVLNFLKGPDYHMFLPLYYVVDDDVGILPPVFLAGRDYWASIPLLSGAWRYADGDRATWITPFFHVTEGGDGRIRNLHALAYFQGENSWIAPPLLSGGGTYPDGSRVLWVTPLFHWTTDVEGRMSSMHAGFYFQSPTSWAVLPLLTWHGQGESGTSSTWVTPLFHWSQDPDGGFSSMHLGPYLCGREYWMLLPLAGGGTTSNGSSVTWITPLFHATVDPQGEWQSFHVGPYFDEKDWWMIPPLLTFGWTDSNQDKRMTTALLFWLHLDGQRAPVSSTLFPVAFWVRDEHWFVLPLMTGHWRFSDGAQSTWISPFFHIASDKEGGMTDFHVLTYFEGDNYWTIPPLFAWHATYSDGTKTTWLTPLFHLTLDPQGNARSLHVGPYFQGEGYWAVPPLLSWHKRYEDGVEATWLTPLFHLTADAQGSWSSLHLFPAFFYERDSYWSVPPLFSGSGRYRDGSWTTWLTPLVHAGGDKEGEIDRLDLSPVWYWSKDHYWAIPPLLLAGGTHADGAESLWITPLFHDTVDKGGELESLHVFPFWFWKKGEYWSLPPLLSGGFTRPDGSRRTWVTPLYHDDYTKEDALVSRHVLTYFEGPGYQHVIPFYWDWTTRNEVRHTMVPPLYFRTEEPNGDVTASLPWPLLSVRSGQALDESIGMELRPFLVQNAGQDYEVNVLWRMFSVLHEEKSTRVMVGPLWRSEKPDQENAMMSFQILGGLFARDCNYETQRYRYRLLWAIPLGANSMAP
ncbi:MAG TPA: hypothetical protein VKU80_01820 [Planctomycetota bacterium]|nr:hypothetical protein [Planctomycetota bacterium]